MAISTMAPQKISVPGFNFEKKDSVLPRLPGRFPALDDNQNTVRDLVQYDAGTGITSVVDHNTYSAFGSKLTQSDVTHDVIFGYNGSYDDSTWSGTGLQWNRAAVVRSLSWPLDEPRPDWFSRRSFQCLSLCEQFPNELD